ncbi:MAG: acyl-CoA dehydrogenase family protein [Mycobacteriaceae bacterium]
MDFTFTEAQQELSGLTRSIVTTLSTPQRQRELDTATDRYDRALWLQLSKADVLTTALPESLGGSGFGFLEQCSILVELGRGLAAVPYLPSISLGISAIAEFGTDEQKNQWTKCVTSAESIITIALENSLGTNGVQAKLLGNSWSLTGSKTMIPFACSAEAFLVPAQTETGTQVFIVPAKSSNLTVHKLNSVDHSSLGLLELQNTNIPASGLIPGGETVFNWLLTRAILATCAFQMGVLERALELTAEYACTRIQFGKPIGGFQAVAQRLADAFINVKALKLTTWQAAWRLNEGLPAELHTATAKFWAAEAGHHVAHSTVHIHGGVGLDREHPVHRYFLAAKQGEFTLGSATDQLLRIGTELSNTSPR